MCDIVTTLIGPCLGEVPTVQCARKEVKRRKKHTDSEEEYRGRGRGGGRGQGEHEPLQGLSRTSPKPAASDFFCCFSFLIPSSFGLLPPRQLYKATHRITVNYYLMVSTNLLDASVLHPDGAAAGAPGGLLVAWAGREGRRGLLSTD